jgi:GNAT superfamily N-acetyltransferase
VITLRRATADDIGTIVDLLAECFPNNPKADPEVMRWQYWDNPFGDAMVWLAFDGDRPVGTCSGFPIPARMNGRSILAAKGADAGTVPEARGQGLFPKLYGNVIEDANQRGIPVIFSHPKNPASARPQLRMGMKAVTDSIPAYVAPMPAARGIPAGGLLRPVFGRWLPRPSAGLRLDVVGDTPDGLDDLWLRWQPDFGVIHDSAWWDWRYARPDVDYTRIAVRDAGRLTAVAVGLLQPLQGLPMVHVLDLVADGPDAARTALAGLAEALPDAAAITGIALAGSRLAGLLRAARLIRVPARIAPAVTFGVRATSGPTTDELAGAPWQLSWCDLDHL